MTAVDYSGGHQRLVAKATRQKKTFLVLARVARVPIPTDLWPIPNYGDFTKRELQRHCDDLAHDLWQLSGRMLISGSQISDRGIRWLAERYDRWQSMEFGVCALCTMNELERHVGRLRLTIERDVPPYAEVLMQGPHDAAFRHPEYMLVRDLSLLLDLYLDAESLLEAVDWSRPPIWAPGASENAQALGRAVIQSCFALLESFVSGLAHAFIQSSANPLKPDLQERLLDLNSPLKKRIRSIPSDIAPGRKGLDANKPPLSTLFNEIKIRRDSFVHCEPGEQPSSRGHVKQDLFHEVTPSVVKSAVASAHCAIRETWRQVHDRPGPRWLPDLDTSGRLVTGTNLTVLPRSDGPVASGA